MPMSSVAGMTIALALLAVLVIGVLTYMSALVRKAVELKMELNAAIDRRMAEVEADVAERSKRIRREVQDDVSKLKEQVARDADRHAETVAAAAQTQVTALREEAQGVLAAHAQSIDDLRRRQADLQRALEAVGRDLARLGAAPPAPPVAAKPRPAAVPPAAGPIPAE